MISIFTTCAPFKGAIGIRQKNAIRSWKAAFTDAEIILFGEGEGYADVAEEFGLRRFPEVLCNKSGLPRIDSIFAEGEKLASFPYKAYVNADIIITSSTRRALEAIPLPSFLMVARRWNLEVTGELDTTRQGWEDRIWQEALQRGKPARGDAIDIFIWRGEVWDKIPPMVISRTVFDNWLIYSCRTRKIPVVDASDVGPVIHQTHDYGHVAGGRAGSTYLEEATFNATLAGGPDYFFAITDADWRLTSRGLRRNFCDGDSARCAQVYQTLRNRRPRRAPLLECWYEFLIRLQKAWHGNLLPVLKFPLWILLRLIGRRGGKASTSVSALS